MRKPWPMQLRSQHLPSFADYEIYRARFGVDSEFIAADKIRDDSGCVVRYERSSMRPVLTGPVAD